MRHFRLFPFVCRRVPAVLAVVLTLVVALSADAAEGLPNPPSGQGGASNDPLIVGVVKDFPPYYVPRSDGTTGGFAIDVMNTIAKRAGLHVVYRTFDNWEELSAALKNRTVSAVPNMGITDARRKYLDFADPYEQFFISLFAKREKAKGFSTSIVKDVRIATSLTNAAENILKLKGYENVLVLPTSREVVSALIDDQVDLIALPEAVVMSHLAELGMEGEIVTVGNRLASISRSIAVVKGHESLVSALNAAIEDFLASPEYEITYAKWLEKSGHVWTLQDLVIVVAGLVATAILLVWALFRFTFRLGKRSESERLTATYRSEKLMRQRMVLLTAVMLLTTAATMFFGLNLHYRASLQQYRTTLYEALVQQVSLIEEIFTSAHNPEQEFSAFERNKIIAQIVASLSRRSSDTSNALAYLEGDTMRFVLRQHHFHQHPDISLPLSSSLSEPMRAALSGGSGSMFGLDFSGTEVLAVYDYIPGLGLGIVLKRDMHDIQSPYFKVGVAASFIAFLVAMAGVLVYIRIASPMLRETYANSALFEGIMNNAQPLIFVRDQFQKLLYANKAYCDLFGLSLEDMISNPEKQKISPEDIARFREQDLQVIKFKKPIDLEDVLTIDGKERVFVTKKFPIFSPNGSIEAIGSISVDATQKHAVEQKLVMSEARFRAAFEKSAVGLTILNEHGRYINVNARMCKITGYGRDDLLSRSPLDITFPDDIEQEKALIQSMVNGEETFATHEKRYVHKDGSTVYVRVSSSVVTGDDGAFEYLINVVEDINAQVEAQKNIILQRDRFRRYLDVSGTLILVLDLAGNIQTINRYALDLLGYEEGELLGSNWFDIAIPDNQRDGARKVAQTIANKDLSTFSTYENEIVTRTGARRLISWSNTFIEDEYGIAQSLLSSGVDITDTRKNQNDLLKANMALRAISRCNEVLVHSSNEQQLLSDICRTIVEETEFCLSWVALVDENHEMDVVRESIFGRGQEAVSAIMIDFKESLLFETVQGLVIEDLTQYEKLTYNASDAERYGVYSLCVFPIHDKGVMYGAFFIGAPNKDAFDQREIDLLHELSDDLSYGILSLRNEKKRQASELQAQLFVANAYDAIVTADAQGCIVQFNPAAEAMFKVSSADAIGQPIADLLVPERFREAHSKAYERFVRSGIKQGFGTRYESIALRADGTEFPIELSLSSVSTNEMETCSAVIRDISDRKEAERQRRQAQNMESLGNMAGGIAHDINNMLLPILTLTDMVKRTLEPESPNAVKLDKVLQAAGHMEELVKGILSFSRQSDPKFENMDIHEVIQKTLGLIEQTTLKTVTITKTLEDFEGLVYADAGQITSALINLVSNSSYAMAMHTGHIEIRLEKVRLPKALSASHPDLPNGEYARVSVIDDGEGIPEVFLARVIDPFFTTKAPGEGTGLGLSMVHGIVAAHGGVMDISSKVGQGTRVDLYFPLKDNNSVKSENDPTKAT